MDLPLGWERTGVLSRIRLGSALRRQMGIGHVLEGQSVSAIARESGGDTVLFQLQDGRVALVHLTWQKEAEAQWPSAAIYDSADDAFASLLPPEDHTPILCSECGSNWSANEARVDCGTCGGYALFRPCPVCDGTCGATWERAVIDSQDSSSPIFLGSCRNQAS